MKSFKISMIALIGILLLALISCNSGKHDKAAVTGGDALSRGKVIYERTCIACHLVDGKGMANSFPPLAKSDFLAKDKTQAIIQVINGKVGEMKVNGQTYNNIMPPQALNDEEIADVLTYVYGSFGNDGQKVTLDEVKAVRSQLK